MEYFTAMKTNENDDLHLHTHHGGMSQMQCEVQEAEHKRICGT